MLKFKRKKSLLTYLSSVRVY